MATPLPRGCRSTASSSNCWHVTKGCAAAAAQPFVTCQQFEEEAVERQPLGNGVAMTAMGRGDGVPRRQRTHYADRHGLLAYAQVNEPGNLAVSEQPAEAFLRAADQEQLAIQ